MRSNERRFFSWSWDWQDWWLPQPFLNHMREGEHSGIDAAHLVEEEDIADLTEIADELAHLIQPALPDPIFRAGLKLALITAHEQTTPWRIYFLIRSDSPLRPWQVIATVPVLVGVAALIWRYRQRSDAQPSKTA